MNPIENLHRITATNGIAATTLKTGLRSAEYISFRPLYVYLFLCKRSYTSLNYLIKVILCRLFLCTPRMMLLEGTTRGVLWSSWGLFFHLSRWLRGRPRDSEVTSNVVTRVFKMECRWFLLIIKRKRHMALSNSGSSRMTSGEIISVDLYDCYNC